MGLLDTILGFEAQTPTAFPHDSADERAWRPFGGREYWGGFSGPALAGNYVRPDEAIGVSCVFAAVRIWCNVLGTSPIRFYRRLSSGEETPIQNYRLAKLLSTDGMANPWQSSIVWRMWNLSQQMLWGLGLNEIKFGPDGLELWPVEGDYIQKVEQIDSGKVRFKISEPGQVPRTLTQDQVLRIDGGSTHKLIPESVLRRAREAVGAWLAQEQYRSFYYRNGASPSVVFSHPGPSPLSDKALTRLKLQLQGRTGGVNNAHKAIITEEGMTAKALGTTAKDALLVDAWNNQVLEFARFTGTPAWMLDATAQLPYNSREQAMREWVDIEVKPRARLIEGAWKRDLFVEENVVCEHDLNDLKRGDAQAQQIADCGYVLGGIKTPEEVRLDLGLSAVPRVGELKRSANIGTDPGGDNRPNPRPDPTNTPPATPPGEGAPKQGPPGKKKKKSASERRIGAAWDVLPEHVRAALESLDQQPKVGYSAHYRQVVTHAARSLLRRETEHVRRRGVQLAGDPAAWKIWLAEFYLNHGQKMAEGLALGVEQVRAYTRVHKDELEHEGIGVCERWEAGEEAVRVMVEMAIKEESAA